MDTITYTKPDGTKVEVENNPDNKRAAEAAGWTVKAAKKAKKD